MFEPYDSFSSRNLFVANLVNKEVFPTVNPPTKITFPLIVEIYDSLFNIYLKFIINSDNTKILKLSF